MSEIYKQAWPYAYIYGGKRKVLLWFYGIDGPNYLHKDVHGKILVAKDEIDLADLANNQNIHFEIVWDECAESNFDDFFKALNELPHSEEIPADICNLLLEGINLLEDLAQTLNIYDELLLFSNSQYEIYNKIYCGVEGVLFKDRGKNYHPEFTYEEIEVLKLAVKDAWNQIVVLAPEVVN